MIDRIEAFSRRNILKRAAIGSAALAVGAVLPGCAGSGGSSGSASMDQQILGAAKIAEALAVTMYTGFINSTLFSSLGANTQSYFHAARNEEKFHYDLLKSSTGNTDAGTSYFFPTGMFTDAQVTINTIVTLE